MQIDFETVDWKKAAFIFLGALSIIPLHVASFTFALPAPFRLILDTEIKASIAVDVATKAILISFIARYIPQFVYGVISAVHGMRIEAKYYKRGFRRVYVSFSGFGKNSRNIPAEGGQLKYLQRSSDFDRAKARFYNLRKSSLQKMCRIEDYEAHRNSITAILGVSLFAFSYLGLFRGLIVLFAVALFAVSSISYSSSSTAFRFRLSKEFWNDYRAKPQYQLDVDDLVMIVSALACAALLSGYFRVGYLSSSATAVLGERSTPVSLIASNSEGLLVYDVNESFSFIAWPKNIRER